MIFALDDLMSRALATLDSMTQSPPTPDGLASSADFGQALGSVLRRYLHGAHEVLADVPGGPRGYQVLLVSSSEECSNQAGIAALLGLDRTAVTYLVDDLERDGLVERRPDPADRRARHVVLTPKGREILEALSRRIQDVEREVLSALSDEESDLFRSMLARLTDTVPTVGACDLPADSAC